MQITNILLPTTAIYYQDRHYHTLEHVQKVIEVTRTMKPDDEFSVEMAALFHDIEYKPGASDNEEKSALFAAEYLAFYNHPYENVKRLILATKHTGKETDRDAQIICDADLFELGGHPSEYEANALNIRKEFKHFTQAQWVQGRIAFLTEFLKRDRIFYILTDREKQARINMGEELKRLTK